MSIMKIVNIVLIGAILASAGVTVTSHWQAWAIIALAGFVSVDWK